MLACVQADPGVSSALLSERQQARHQLRRNAVAGILKRGHVKAHRPAEWRRLDANALNGLQKIQNVRAGHHRLRRSLWRV
jgi:hypothetical protein